MVVRDGRILLASRFGSWPDSVFTVVSAVLGKYAEKSAPGLVSLLQPHGLGDIETGSAISQVFGLLISSLQSYAVAEDGGE